ncbi:MAG: transposase [Armatimonadetes bacterium]|nr:transposase [Armatimonadota bacterium]
MFTRPTWKRVPVLVEGVLLALHRRTVSAALRAAGRDRASGFARYHRVLNRARWSARAAARVLLGLLVTAFAPDGPVVIGVDDTLERRWGRRIGARGIYRDAVRSSHGHFVKASGLRWVSLSLLAPIPWAAGRVWALPFLTVLAPSERFARERGSSHKKLTDWARQALLQAARWLPPGRRVVAVTDSGYAALDLLGSVRRRMCVVTRLRLDARLFDPAPPRRPGTIGRPRLVGRRQPTLARRLVDPHTRWQAIIVAGWYGGEDRRVEVATGTAVWHHPGLPVVPLRWVLVRDPMGEFRPQAFLCTDPEAAPADILAWFVRRWSTEVTFQEARRHLGVETQRQWSDLAIARTTPCLLGLYSLVTLWAHDLRRSHRLLPSTAAWYAKERITFSDALAIVRRALWAEAALRTSRRQRDLVEVPRPLLSRLTMLACYAA